MTPTPDQSHLATCPRCIYSLQGEVDRWVEACAVHGKCPECGLDFEWSELLVHGKRWHPDFFECPGEPLRQLVRTWVRAVNPAAFWR